jgi:hypothetical protein
MKLRIRTFSTAEITETREYEIPDHTATVELDVMGDVRVRFLVDKDKKPKDKT